MTADPDKQAGRFVCLQYVPDADGTLVPQVSDQYMKAQFGHIYDERLAKIRRENLAELLAGRITPVAFYRTFLDMTVIELAKRTGLSRRTVRRHETVGGFDKATVGQLRRYAVIFGVPLSALFCLLDPAVEELNLTLEESQSGLSCIVRPGRKDS